MDFNEKVSLAKQDLISVLTSNDVSYTKALVYADKYACEFVEKGVWSQNSLDDLEEMVRLGESNKHGSKYDHPVYNDISKAIRRYVLTFAERARLELERTELSDDEASSLKEDLLALEEMESICSGNDTCTVTNEHKELMQILMEGLDPDKFNSDIKSSVTKEEIEQFRSLGKKFLLNEELIAQQIERVTQGTPTSYVQNIIYRQNIIDHRKSKNLFAINSCRGSFKREKGLNG